MLCGLRVVGNHGCVKTKKPARGGFDLNYEVRHIACVANIPVAIEARFPHAKQPDQLISYSRSSSLMG